MTITNVNINSRSNQQTQQTQQQNSVQGVLGRKGMFGWKEEYWVLRSHYLCLYQTKGHCDLGRHKKLYNVLDSTISDAGLVEYRHAFILDCRNRRRVILAATTKDQKREWMEALKSASSPLSSPSFLLQPASSSMTAPKSHNTRQTTSATIRGYINTRRTLNDFLSPSPLPYPSPTSSPMPSPSHSPNSSSIQLVPHSPTSLISITPTSTTEISTMHSMTTQSRTQNTRSNSHNTSRPQMTRASSETFQRSSQASPITNSNSQRVDVSLPTSDNRSNPGQMSYRTSSEASSRQTRARRALDIDDLPAYDYQPRRYGHNSTSDYDDLPPAYSIREMIITQRDILIQQEQIRNRTNSVSSSDSSSSDEQGMNGLQDRLQSMNLRIPNIEIERMLDGVVVGSLSGVIVATNRQAEIMFGYTRNELQNKPITNLMPEPYNLLHDAYMFRHERNGPSPNAYHKRAVEGLRKNGERFPMMLTLKKMEDEGYYFVTLRELAL